MEDNMKFFKSKQHKDNREKDYIYWKKRYKFSMWTLRLIFFFLLATSYLLLLSLGAFPLNQELETQQFAYNEISSDQIFFLGNFTFAEKQKINNWMLKDLKNIYRPFVKDIYFIKCDEVNHEICEENFYGQNQVILKKFPMGDIYMNYNKFRTKSEFRKVICHEILHNALRRDEKSHLLIYDISEKGVCWEWKNTK